MILRYGREVICTNYAHGGALAFAVLFLFIFVGNSWGACYSNGPYTASAPCPGSCPDPFPQSWGVLYGDVTGELFCWQGSMTCRYQGYCSRQCEAEQLVCEQKGGAWENTGAETCDGYECTYCDAQCECEEQGMIWTGTECIEDTTVCSEYRSQCAGLGGDFTGSIIHMTEGNCCAAVCDLCGSSPMERLSNLKRDECCSQLKAPPENNVVCSTPVQSGCGFTTSQFDNPSTGEWACQDPNLDQETMSRYIEQCSEEQSSSSCEGENCGPGGGSSSSGGGTSSEGGTSSAQGPYGDCQECPWLDSILDTLVDVKHITDDIKLCLQVPGACPGISIPDSIKTPVFAFDTAFRKYLQPLMDSMLKVDSNQLKALFKLDTNQLKLLAVDSQALRNDTMTWVKFDALGNVIDTSVHSMNDTTRKWFKRIADSIGVSTDTLAAHIDSIVRHIPDSVLDSIVKYQQYATDNFDSVLYGTGKGFSLVDSLIDSAVHYFKTAGHYDSIYRKMFADSVSALHAALDDLPEGNARAIGYGLGYGDTASTTLRGDLNGIREAIEGLGDSIGGFGGGFDTAMYGGNYGARSVDTSYGSWINTMSNRYSNLAKNAAGGDWGDSATLETVFATTPDDTAGNSPRGQDSAADAQYSYLTDSAETMLARAKDTLLKDTSLLRAYYDTLKTEMQIWNFDSILIGPIREAIPDNNTCPEDCFKGQFALPGAGDIAYDYGLCRRWPILMDQDIFMFIRVVLRLLTAVACIYIGMWAIAGGKN